MPCHPKEGQFLRLTDFEGNDSVRLPNLHCCLKAVKCSKEGSTLLSVGHHEAVVWQQYKKPMLEHLLFRLVLNRYFEACIKAGVQPELCATQDKLPLWMAHKFNIKGSDLEQAWGSMESDLQKSIFNTLVHRASKIGKAAND